MSAACAKDAFHKEFLCFVMNRQNVRRFMATQDRFPLFCELVAEAKKHYVSLPRIDRHTRKYIPFEYFGRHWAMRINAGAYSRSREAFIDLCLADSKSVIATVAVEFDNDWLEASNYEAFL